MEKTKKQVLAKLGGRIINMYRELRKNGGRYYSCRKCGAFISPAKRDAQAPKGRRPARYGKNGNPPICAECISEGSHGRPFLRTMPPQEIEDTIREYGSILGVS